MDADGFGPWFFFSFFFVYRDARGEYGLSYMFRSPTRVN